MITRSTSASPADHCVSSLLELESSETNIGWQTAVTVTTIATSNLQLTGTLVNRGHIYPEQASIDGDKE